MANSVSTPFPFFAGLDGDALEGGKIYIGDDGLDAATNPKAAYFDRDLLVPAAQPIRTISGYAVNGSSAAQIFTDGAYSISVYTSADVLVFSSLSESGDISVIEADVGANTAAIAALGTASSEDFTDSDDLAVDPDNVGTRGNTKAYVEAQISTIPGYEAGDWAPIISEYVFPNSTGTAWAMNINYATYTKIGARVTVECYLTSIAKDVAGTPASGVVITGLPYAPSEQYFGILINPSEDVTTTGTIYVGVNDPYGIPVTSVLLYDEINRITVSDFPASGVSLFMSVTYITED